MKIQKIDGRLQFVADKNESEENLAFIQRMEKYTLKANGAMILVFDNNRLITCINPADNTQLVCAADGAALANEFSGKRFLVGEARQMGAEFKAMKWAKDLDFPIAKRDPETAITYATFDLDGALKYFRSDEYGFYDQLAELYNRCADFSPGKQDEYNTGGKLEDKYCRFNRENSIGEPRMFNEHFFLVENNRVVGALSANVLLHEDRSADIYFYDEVADYDTMLDNRARQELAALRQKIGAEVAAIEIEIEALKKLIEQCAEDDPIRATLNTAKAGLEKRRIESLNQVSTIVEPLRATIMAQLFALVREKLRVEIIDLDKRIEKGQVNAFIRATNGRHDSVEQFASLGCSATNESHFVIHGRPTPQLVMLTDYVKSEWAASQLKRLLQARPSTTTFMGQSVAAGAAATAEEKAAPASHARASRT